MSITISRVKGMKLKAEVDGFTIITGQIDETTPIEGPSPGRLMVASLGLCSEFYAALYLKKHKISDEGLTVEIKETNWQNPSRAISFEIDVKVKAVLTDEQNSGIMNNV
ncbi:MAG: OsmC family protein, partial [Candidatus Bathyarchaeota archaeon]|nr:OsmC family protein [Candidatus Bathyarchaeota archaeon]